MKYDALLRLAIPSVTPPPSHHPRSRRSLLVLSALSASSAVARPPGPAECCVPFDQVFIIGVVARSLARPSKAGLPVVVVVVVGGKRSIRAHEEAPEKSPGIPPPVNEKHPAHPAQWPGSLQRVECSPPVARGIAEVLLAIHQVTDWHAELYQLGDS